MALLHRLRYSGSCLYVSDVVEEHLIRGSWLNADTAWVGPQWSLISPAFLTSPQVLSTQEPLRFFSSPRLWLLWSRVSSPMGFQVALVVKNSCDCRRHKRWGFDPCVWDGPLEEGMTTHSTILAWRIPRTEEPGGLSPQRVRNDLET